MKTFRKMTLIVLALSLVMSGCVLGGTKKIGKTEALEIALTDAGLTKDQVVDIDIELERSAGSAWYEIDFESGRTEYEYKIDARSGEILSGRTD